MDNPYLAKGMHEQGWIDGQHAARVADHAEYLGVSDSNCELVFQIILEMSLFENYKQSSSILKFEDENRVELYSSDDLI